jgi:hypothetical protein
MTLSAVHSFTCMFPVCFHDVLLSVFLVNGPSVIVNHLHMDLTPVVTIVVCRACSVMNSARVFTSYCICVVSMIFRISSQYFSGQHEPTFVMEMQRVCNEVHTEFWNVMCMYLMIQLFCRYADFEFLYL